MRVTDHNKTLALVVIGFIVFGLIMFFTGQQSTVGTAQTGSVISQQPTVSIDDNLGDSATLTINAFTGRHGDEGAETEVYPTYTIVKNGNSKIVNDAGANTTTSLVVGDTVSVYCTGATYYCDAVPNVKVTKTQQTINLNAYSVAATTDLVLKVYDEDDTALTADDNSNNTADYAGGNVAAADEQEYYLKLTQTGANKNFMLGAICTYMLGDEADDIELKVSGWKEVSVPDKLDATSITAYDDGNASTAEKGYRNCYEPSSPIHLKENMDTGKLKLVFNSDDTTQPTANGDTYFGVVVMDSSYSVDGDGNIVRGFYMDDDTEDPGAVGLDENPDTTWTGLDTAVQVEPQ